MTVRLRLWPLVLLLSAVLSFIGPTPGHTVMAAQRTRANSLRPAAATTTASRHALTAPRAAASVPRLDVAARRTDGLISQWCVWVRDCNFVTYQPGVTTVDWYPTPLGSASTYVTSVLDTVTGQTARAVYMPYGSAFEENVNFGAYNPQVTYAYTLTFDAQAIKVDPDAHSAELYVGFSPDTCSYDWQVVSAEPPTNGWHHYVIVGPSPSYSQSQTAPPLWSAS